MPRLTLPSPDEMSVEQRAVYDEVVSGPRGRLVGPLRAVIHSPDLARRWSRFGEYLRYSTCLPKKLSELAIIIAGRRWNSQLEFHIHAAEARAAGLDADAIEAIRVGDPPFFTDEAEFEIYEFSRVLLETGNVGDALHASLKRRWGERGVVELTALIGYYSMVSMMLNAQEVPLLPGATPPLSAPRDGGLWVMPPAAGFREKVA